MMARYQMRRCAALLSAYALICQLVQQQASLPVSAYSITSQYLGAAPSRGNEHLLLFKLPDTISSQLLEQQQQQSRLLLQNPNSRQFVGPQQIHSTLGQNYEPPSSPQVQEQQISLTIPLSTLHTADPHQAMSPLQYAAPSQQQQQQQTPKQVALELALDDYLANQPPAQDSHQVVYAPVQEQQNTRQALQDSLAGRNFSQQPVSSSSYGQPEPQLEQQPSLWRDTQAAQPATPTSNPDQASSQSEIMSLISKLSNSSPDLLIRLRNLLKRAATQHQLDNGNSLAPAYNQSYSSGLRPFDRSSRHFALSEANNNPNNNELLMANNVAPSEIKNLVYNYITSQQQQQQQAGDSKSADRASQNSLSAFLSSQNMSSHEEIKIPFIVIAMPRILSLRRNQSAAKSSSSVASQQASNSSASGLPAITSELARHLVKQQLPQMFASSSNSSSLAGGPPMTNLLNDTTTSTSTNNNNYYNLSQPSRYAPPSANASQTYWMQASTTTSLPLYTMAPYAHQFAMPRLAGVPLIRDFLPIHHHQHQQQLIEPAAPSSSYYPSSQVKQLAPQFGSNQSVYFAESPTVQLAQRPLVSTPTVIVGRPSGLVTNSTSLPYSGQNVQIHLIDSHSGDQDQQVLSGSSSGSSSRQKSGGPFHFEQRQQPLFEVQPEPLEQQQPSVEAGQSQQLIYLNPNTQRRAVMPDGRVYNFTSDDSSSSSDSKLKSYLTEQLQARPQSHQQSRLSLIEEQIRNLRPLFQASKRLGGGDVYSQGGEHQRMPPFSPSQMVALLTKSSERRNSQEQEPVSNNNNNHSRAKGSQKKLSKMVLMIV